MTHNIVPRRARIVYRSKGWNVNVHYLALLRAS